MNSLNNQPEPAEFKEANTAWRFGGGEGEDGTYIRSIGEVWGRAEFEFGAEGKHPESGEGQGQPEACDTSRVGHLGILPLPCAAFEGLEALFAPGTQAVPLGVAAISGEVGENEPGFIMSIAPPGDQSAFETRASGDEGGARATPGVTDLADQCAQRQPLTLSVGTKLALLIDA